jgi:hydrogenase/urease accessory protein HupE
MKSEGGMSKSERRPKAETRSPFAFSQARLPALKIDREIHFGFRISSFSRVSGIRISPFAILLSLLCIVSLASAHELRPAYLELRETRTGEFSVLWKTPMLGDARLALEPAFSGDAKALTPVTTRTPPGAAVQQWTVRAPALRGQAVCIRGLEGTMTDALVRIEFADGTSWTERLTPQQPTAVIPARQGWFSVAGVYLKLGVEHILTGIDHLLFILALIIITRGGWKLVKTVTAFTVSHSFTLTAATLGFVHVPQRPVEAVIALSIVFVACEIVHRRQGWSGLTERWPWIVALTFGLLHGLGFAGALSEIGLPQGHIPLALLFFSVGVEIGQLTFIAAVLSLVAVMQRVSVPIPRWGEFIPPYAIGSVAMFWIIQRVALF